MRFRAHHLRPALLPSLLRSAVASFIVGTPARAIATDVDWY
jgi:hypothetical protein